MRFLVPLLILCQVFFVTSLPLSVSSHDLQFKQKIQTLRVKKAHAQTHGVFTDSPALDSTGLTWRPLIDQFKKKVMGYMPGGFGEKERKSLVGPLTNLFNAVQHKLNVLIIGDGGAVDGLQLALNSINDNGDFTGFESIIGSDVKLVTVKFSDLSMSDDPKDSIVEELGLKIDEKNFNDHRIKVDSLRLVAEVNAARESNKLVPASFDLILMKQGICHCPHETNVDVACAVPDRNEYVPFLKGVAELLNANGIGILNAATRCDSETTIAAWSEAAQNACADVDKLDITLIKQAPITLFIEKKL